MVSRPCQDHVQCCLHVKDQFQILCAGNIFMLLKPDSETYAAGPLGTGNSGAVREQL